MFATKEKNAPSFAILRKEIRNFLRVEILGENFAYFCFKRREAWFLLLQQRALLPAAE
jgi:hypothetical protein